MAKYIAKRVALAIVTLLVLTSVVFVLVRLMPGDPFSSDKMTPEIKANLEAYYGLDKPLAEQYITYMKNVLHGDLGYSMKYESQTVNRIIADSFPYSADLGIRSLCFALFFGLILGIVAALNRGKKLDFVCILIAIIGTSIPDFIMGSVLQYFFGIKWQILPVAQYTSFKHTILPFNRGWILYTGIHFPSDAFQYAGSCIFRLYKDSTCERFIGFPNYS